MSRDSEPDPTLEAAIRAVRAGDVEAFEVVLRRFQEPLRAYFARRSPASAAPDDLAQNAFVTAFVRLDTYQGGDFGAWLFGIARNLLRRSWDEAGRTVRHRSAIEAILRRRRIETDAPSTAAAEADRLAALRLCLEDLPERWRTLTREHYEDGRSQVEIAGRLGNAASTVGVTLFRIRQRLRQCIELRLAGEAS